MLKKVPNSHDYYFDIVSDNYQVVQTVATPEFFGFHTKVSDTPHIRYLFEECKRAEIEKLIRSNFDLKGSTPGKTPTTKAGPETPSHFTKITPEQQNIFFDLPTPAKTSGSPNQYNYFYQSAGIRRTHQASPVHLDFSDWTIYDVLTIPELQDVPFFVPLIRELLVVRLKPVILRNRQEKMGDKFDYATEEKNVSFSDINTGIKEGLIDWGELEFSRECLNYIQRNIHQVLDA